jgi:hypothetical protein
MRRPFGLRWNVASSAESSSNTHQSLIRMEREPSATPPNFSGAIGGDDEGVAFISADELRPPGGQNHCLHGRLMHEAHGTGEQCRLPLVLHCCVVAGEQAGLMACSVASDAGGKAGGITAKARAIRWACSRWRAEHGALRGAPVGRGSGPRSSREGKTFPTKRAG